jgi:hypothetical protein
LLALTFFCNTKDYATHIIPMNTTEITMFKAIVEAYILDQQNASKQVRGLQEELNLLNCKNLSLEAEIQFEKHKSENLTTAIKTASTLIYAEDYSTYCIIDEKPETGWIRKEQKAVYEILTSAIS